MQTKNRKKDTEHIFLFAMRKSTVYSRQCPVYIICKLCKSKVGYILSALHNVQIVRELSRLVTVHSYCLLVGGL